MDAPCLQGDSVPLWVFLIMGVLSHARGAALLLRECLSWATRLRKSRRRRRTPLTVIRGSALTRI